jgi:serine/threonine protein kinase
MNDHNEGSRSLIPGARVADYQIISVLGQGAFGITYLATDLNLQIQVAIKEYFPREFSVRSARNTVRPSGSREDKDFFEWGRDRFLSEARILARLDHPNIAAVRRLLEANDTAYLVMDYCDGKPLDEIIERDGPLNVPDFEKLLWPILDALHHVHKSGLIHRDVKPANIFIRSDGSPVLLDFGAARNDISQHSRSVTSLATAGYAPLEQYDTRGNQGPWSDIYGFSATLYRALTGERPPDAAGRVLRDTLEPLSQRLRGKVDERVLMAIDKGLAVLPDARPQTVSEWRSLFGGHLPSSTVVDRSSEQEQLARREDKTISSGSYETQIKPKELRNSKNGNRPLIWGSSLVVIVVLLAWLSSISDSPQNTEKSEITAINVTGTSESSSVKDTGSSPKAVERKEPAKNAANESSGPSQTKQEVDCPEDKPTSEWTDCTGTRVLDGIHTYTGNFKAGEANGSGKMELRGKYEGHTYVGSFKNDLFHGKGTYRFADGTKYVGNWRDGENHGKGTVIFASGDKYQGGFKKNKFHGKGKYTYKNGDTFTGTYVDGKREGPGIYRFRSGQESESVYVAGEETNPITVRLTNGDVYVGDVSKETNSWEGRGTYSFKEGGKFIGSYKDGKRDGFGILYDSKGEALFSGTWKDNEFISSNAGKSAPQSSVNDLSEPPYYARVAPVISPRASNAATLKLCRSFSEKTNEALPIKLDLVTTYSRASCKETARGIVLIARHEYEGELPISSSTEEMYTALRKDLVKRWCTEPPLKPLLKTVSVEYHYYDVNNNLGIVIEIQSDDCR